MMSDIINNVVLSEALSYVEDNATKFCLCTSSALVSGNITYSTANANALCALTSCSSSDFSQGSGTGTASLVFSGRMVTATADGDAAYLVFLDDSVSGAEVMLAAIETSTYTTSSGVAFYLPSVTVSISQYQHKRR